MIKENKSTEKSCLFFASDYHFEMISLPYINNKIKEDKNVIIITENDLENTMEKLISRVNLEEKDKNRILELDWKNDDFSKFKNVKKANEENKETVIFIKGKRNYIENVNKNIENWIDNKEINVIDCYDINEIEKSVSDVAKQYNKILSTAGMKNL